MPKKLSTDKSLKTKISGVEHFQLERPLNYHSCFFLSDLNIREDAQKLAEMEAKKPQNDGFILEKLPFLCSTTEVLNLVFTHKDNPFYGAHFLLWALFFALVPNDDSRGFDAILKLLSADFQRLNFNTQYQNPHHPYFGCSTLWIACFLAYHKKPGLLNRIIILPNEIIESLNFNAQPLDSVHPFFGCTVLWWAFILAQEGYHHLLGRILILPQSVVEQFNFSTIGKNASNPYYDISLLCIMTMWAVVYNNYIPLKQVLSLPDAIFSKFNVKSRISFSLHNMNSIQFCCYNALELLSLTSEPCASSALLKIISLYPELSEAKQEDGCFCMILAEIKSIQMRANCLSIGSFEGILQIINQEHYLTEIQKNFCYFLIGHALQDPKEKVVQFEQITIATPYLYQLNTALLCRFYSENLAADPSIVYKMLHYAYLLPKREGIHEYIEYAFRFLGLAQERSPQCESDFKNLFLSLPEINNFLLANEYITHLLKCLKHYLAFKKAMDWVEPLLSSINLDFSNPTISNALTEYKH